MGIQITIKGKKCELLICVFKKPSPLDVFCICSLVALNIRLIIEPQEITLTKDGIVLSSHVLLTKNCVNYFKLVHVVCFPPKS